MPTTPQPTSGEKRPTACLLCGNTALQRTDFTSEACWIEFTHSGLCQKCQDDMILETNRV